MNKRVGRKVGDTLIEVTLAIGIFSMVAIAVVAVMNGGTSSAQTALETTLAREEIDTQAEALRFIQSAYIADKNSGSEGAYTRLWEAIGNLALSSYNDTLSSTPDKCSDLYSGTYYEDNAFIINPKMLNSYEKNYNEATSAYQKTNQLNKVLITSSSNKLTQTTTYPRLVYGTASLNDSANSLYLDTSDNTYNNLYGAQGIYIIAVKDNSSTNIIKDDNTAENDSAFYDFYIRTCWYGNDGETPSTISTVVRLYDPLRTSEIEEAKVAMLRYNDNSNGGATTDGLIGKKLLAGGTETISAVEPVWPGHNFLGWCTSLPNGGSCNGATVKYDNNHCTITEDGNSVNTYKNLISVNSSGACEYAAPTNLTENSYFSLYAMWERIGYIITYNANGGSYKSGSSQKTQVCYYDEPCIIPSTEEEQPRHAYGEFKGWSTSPTANVPNALYAPGSIIAPTNLTLYAVWQKKNGVFAVVAEWNQSADFESNVIGWKSNSQAFTAYYGAVSFSDIDNTPLAILHQDCTSDCHPQNEVFILNTMGGRDYYYYICRYSPGVCGGSVSKDSGITVKLYIKDEETGDTYLTIGGNAANKYDGNYSLVATYSIADAKGDSYGRYWNVFAFKNGWIVNPGGDYDTTIGNYVNQSY